MRQAFTSDHICALLMAGRHADDLCVSECKDGPSQGSTSRRLDLWVMRRSYSKPAMFGYEIKVNRSDFTRDEKWKDYLPLCNQLYFVTPWELVQPHEVPGCAGLLWLSKTGTRFTVKKKADHRDIPPPVGLMTYVLMSRASIKTDYGNTQTREERIAALQRWLASKKDSKELGREIATRIRTEMRIQEAKQNQLSRQIEELERVRDFWTKTLGCKPDDLASAYTYQIERANAAKRDNLRALIDPAVVEELRQAVAALRGFDTLTASLERALKSIITRENT